MIIKSHCEKCNDVQVYSTKEKIKLAFSSIIKSTIVSFGLLFLFMLIMVGPKEIVNNIGVSLYLSSESIVDTNELRWEAINATKPCGDGLNVDSRCHAILLFSHLKYTRYVPASHYDVLQEPSETYHCGGDCKHMSMMFVAMMKSLGFSAQVQCNYEEEHCIAVVPNYWNYESIGGFMVIDLTIPGIYEISDAHDIWDYQDGINWGGKE